LDQILEVCRQDLITTIQRFLTTTYSQEEVYTAVINSVLNEDSTAALMTTYNCLVRIGENLPKDIC